MTLSRSGAETTFTYLPLPWKVLSMELTLDATSMSWGKPGRPRRTETVDAIRGFWPVQKLIWSEPEEGDLGPHLDAPWHLVALVTDGTIHLLTFALRDDARYVAAQLNAELVRYRRPHSPYRD